MSASLVHRPLAARSRRRAGASRVLALALPLAVATSMASADDPAGSQDGVLLLAVAAPAHRETDPGEPLRRPLALRPREVSPRAVEYARPAERRDRYAQLDAAPPTPAGDPGAVAAAPPLAPLELEPLVATLAQMPLPSYVAPEQARPLGWRRSLGAVRAGGAGARIDVLAPPDHVGLALSDAPRLWWRLDRDTRHALQLTIVDDDAIDPVFVAELPGPHAAGFHALDLAEHGVRLTPGADYRWFVSIQVDAERPSRNPISEGAIRVVDRADDRRIELAATPEPRKGHAMAEAGVWYDAFDFFSTVSEANRRVESIDRHRARLSRTVLPGD